MRKIEITCAADGSVKIDALGFRGQGCKDATKVFEDAFAGAKKLDQRDKSELYMPDTQGTGLNARRM